MASTIDYIMKQKVKVQGLSPGPVLFAVIKNNNLINRERRIISALFGGLNGTV